MFIVSRSPRVPAAWLNAARTILSVISALFTSSNPVNTHTASRQSNSSSAQQLTSLYHGIHQCVLSCGCACVRCSADVGPSESDHRRTTDPSTGRSVVHTRPSPPQTHSWTCHTTGSHSTPPPTPSSTACSSCPGSQYAQRTDRRSLQRRTAGRPGWRCGRTGRFASRPKRQRGKRGRHTASQR